MQYKCITTISLKWYKNQNVYDLINSDEDNLADLIEKGDIEVTKNDFKPIVELLNKDLQILEDIWFYGVQLN